MVLDKFLPVIAVRDKSVAREYKFMYIYSENST